MLNILFYYFSGFFILLLILYSLYFLFKTNKLNKIEFYLFFGIFAFFLLSLMIYKTNIFSSLKLYKKFIDLNPQFVEYIYVTDNNTKLHIKDPDEISHFVNQLKLSKFYMPNQSKIVRSYSFNLVLKNREVICFKIFESEDNEVKIELLNSNIPYKYIGIYQNNEIADLFRYYYPDFHENLINSY